MQKQQYFRRDNLPSRKTPTPFVRSTASKLSNVSGSAGSRTDGGRSSLRLDKRPKAISYHHPSKAVDDSAIMDAGELLKENIELKHRLEDEEAKYERRLDTYRQAQQHQAALVSRLQAKVLQYKKRCSDLEGQTKESLPAVDILRSTVRPITAAPGSALDAAQQHLRNIENERITDLDSALRALNDERNRCEKLLDLNNVLREQLEEAQRTNEALTNDLQSLTTDWEQMRDEMLQKEDEWKQEEQFFNEYYTTEQNRILGLWRDINSMKEAFVEMQSTTRKDLNKLKNEITATSSNIVGTCNGILDTKKIVPEEKQQELLKENFDLQTRISVLKNECESLKEQSKMKDEKIQSLTKEIQKLNKKTQESTEASEEISHLQEEVQILLTGLREIAQTVVLDADAKDGDVIHSLPHVHLSSTMPSSSRLAYSEVGLKIQNASAFVESTISGVHAALHKYQSQIHELQIKISSQTEQLSLIERQCETQLDCQQKLTQKMNELVEELDSLRAESNILNQEKESLIKALEGTQEEKQEAVKGRNEMNNLFESLSVDYEKMLKSNNKLQKIALSLEEEKNFLHNEIDRMVKELETREVSCNLVEERCSRMLEELLTVKEDLTKARLDKELIEQHHSEAQSLLALTEKTRAEIESELQKVLMERTEVNDSLSKAENLVQTLEQQKRWLQDELRTTEEEKQKYQNQAADLSNDLGLVRKELVNTEQMRLDLEAERISLSDKYKNLDAENRRLEAELNAVINERAELNNEIVNVRRKKDTLNEELVRLRERIEQVGETNARINKHLEDLVKECEEKQVTLESNESEILHLQELNSLLKAERDSLEASLYETQNHLEISEMKRSTLEKQQQELLSKQETLKSEVQRLSNNIDDMGKSADDSKNKLVQQMKSLEVENAQTVERLKKENEETVSRIKEEKEQACINAEKKMLNALSECEQEKVDQISGMQKKLESLKQHMDMQCQQHEEALRRAESDKQQALLLAHQDQNALMDKLGLIRTELEEEKTNFEKFRREANLKTEQDRNNINSLRDQLTKLTSKIEDLRVKTEEEKNKLMQEIENVKKEREQQLKQCEDLKVELALAEDRLDNIRSQLFDTNHKLKEGEKLTETLRKDLNDIKRQLNESNLEKDKYLLSNKELREFVKKSEAEKREHVRSIEEANQKIIGLEDKLNQLENERARLQNICRDTDSKLMQSNQKCQLLQQEIDKSNAQNQQKENNEKELLLKLNIEIEDKEKAQQDLHNYKKQLAEMEANLDAYQQEINKMRQQTREEEERWHIRESELLSKLDGSRSKERKLEDQKHNLEVCLTESYQQVQDLKAKLSGCECRIRALESQLSQLENSKKQSEEKLKSINNTFKRLGLLQGDSSGETTSSTPLFRLRAARKRSPIKLKGIHDSTVDSSAVVESSNDFDADIIKKSIRSLVQQLAQAEREQDDMKIELENMKKRLNEGEENEKENEVKVNSMIKALRQTNEEKGILEAELSQKKSTLMLEMQTLKHKNEENQQLREKLIATEHHLEKCTEEKGQLEEKLTKIRSCNGQLEMEKDKLKEELSKCDSRSAKLEIQRISLEGDLNRLRMVLQDKDATIQKLQNRLETQCNTIADLEERCASLKATIDQLNVSLEFSATNETELRNEIQSLHKCLNDCSNTCQAYEEKIKQLHKSLTTIENERKLLNEKLDRAENALSDLQKESHIKDDQLTKLQLEVDSKDIQNASLHDQIRISKLSASSEFDDKEALHKLQIECCELRGKNQMLEERLRRLETDKRNLERKLASLRSKSYDRSETGEGYDTFPTLGAVSSSMMNVSLIEHENKDLKEKCNRLEAQLHEKETELTRLRMIGFSRSSVEKSDDLERYRAGQLHAEHLLKAREQSHRQQIEHLKNEIANLKKRLDQETKFRKKYLMESIGEAQNVRQLRDTLANSLRAVSENPSLDALLLDHETRKLNSSVQLARSKLPRTHSILRK